MAQVSLRKIVKEYEGGVQAVKGIDLEIADKEFVVLVGPSGCGKSTTLRMIAGLEEISSGEISIGGSVVNDIPPRDRDIAMVFQNYALYPHMSVYDNMAFGLMLRKFDKGSSNRNTLGSRTMARPMATRCLWPPERALGLRSSNSRMSRMRPASSTRRRISSLGSFRRVRPKAMFSNTVMCG